MKLFHSLVLTLLIGVVSPAFAKENFLCVRQSGDMFFFSFNTVLIERDGKNISVFGIDSGKVIRDDRWTYQVFAENKGLGLQAIRANPESGGASTVAVEYGGLLFLIWAEGKVFAYVVSAQASTKKSESQVLTCERR